MSQICLVNFLGCNFWQPLQIKQGAFVKILPHKMLIFAIFCQFSQSFFEFGMQVKD